MAFRLDDIAKLVSGQLDGPADRTIRGAAPIDKAGPEDITFLAERRYINQTKSSRAGCIIIGGGLGAVEAPSADTAFIRVDNPRLAFAQVLAVLEPEEKPMPGIHETAIIEDGARLGNNVSIQAWVVVGADAVIGDDVCIHPGTVIGKGSRIGDGSTIHANVSIGDHVTVGKSVIVHPGCVIGSDGFGYVTLADGHHKVPQIGTVIIGDDVEIGANSTIDRATCGATVIGRGTKIDNLVQVGHNVHIGEECLVVAMVGIAGSSHLENRVTLAGQSGVTGHLTIGSDTVVAARGLVARDLPPSSYVSGVPARPHKDAMRALAATQRLPRLTDTVQALRRTIADLEDRLEVLEDEFPAGGR